MWINYDKKIENPKIELSFNILFTIIMTLNAFSSLCFVIAEVTYDYSSAYQVAEYINENTKENSIFITAKQSEFVTSIIPYVENDSKFYYIQSGKYYTFVTWDETITSSIDEDFGIENLREIFGENKTIYYIFCPYDMYESISDKEFLNKLQNEIELLPVFVTGKSFASSEDFIVFELQL